MRTSNAASPTAAPVPTPASSSSIGGGVAAAGGQILASTRSSSSRAGSTSLPPHHHHASSANHKFGSVKYNRIAAPPKEEVHESHSNPIPGAACTPVDNKSLVDNRFLPAMSSFTTASECSSTTGGGGAVTPRKMSMLEAPSPLPYMPAAGAASAAASTNTGGSSSTVPRQKQLVLSPPSLHISFDVEPDQTRSQQLVSAMPMSQSSDNVCRQFHPRYDSVGSSCSSTGRSYSPAHLRRTVAYRHSHHRRIFEPSEIAQISAGYMRANGGLQQFKGILSGPEKSPSLLTKVLQKEHSKERDKERDRGDTKDDSCTANLISRSNNHSIYYNNNNNNSVFGSADDVKSTIGFGGVPEMDTLKPIVSASRSPSGAALAGSAAEATVEALKSQTMRLGYRQMLFERRRVACDYSCVFAVLGIVLMIVENEMSAGGVYTKSSPYSYGLKSLIVLSTLVLLSCILFYHAVDIQLFMADLGCHDWRILINAKRLAKISAELLVCCVCPIPGDFHFTWRTVHHDGKTVTAARVPVDVLLSIPMFLRLYLLCRVMLLHSKLFTDAPSRSIGAMNRVNFTARFVLKTLMTISPGTVLLTFTISWWLMAAWVMLLCERFHGYGIESGSNKTVMYYEAIKHQNYLNSLWLVTITSLTIGYGDIVPNTYCGRAVSVICGIMGAGTSSLVVAVVARKLELSRAEKHVHNFMMDSVLTRKLKCAAANVLRETWLIYKHKKLGDKADPSRIRFHQRKFLLAIYQLRKVKRGQRKLSETSTTVADMAKTSSMMYEMIADMRSWQQELDDKLLSMDQRCANVEAYMRQLQISIRALPEVVARKLQRPISSSQASFVPLSMGDTCSLGPSQPPSGVQSTEQPPMVIGGDEYSSPEYPS